MPYARPTGVQDRRARTCTVTRHRSGSHGSRGEDEEGSLPASSRLLDALGLDPPTGPAVLARWATDGRNTRAVVGEGPDGPFSLDVRTDARMR